MSLKSENPGAKLLLPFAFGHAANDWAPVAMWMIIPAFGAALGLSPTEIGLLFTIHSAGTAIAYLPAGYLTDIVANRGRLLVGTFVWVAAGYFIASFADTFWVFAILIALAGLGDAAWHPIATGVLTREFADRKAHAIGIHAIGGHMAEVAAPLFAGLVIGWADWQLALQVSVLPTVIMGVVFVFVARSVPLVERRPPVRADLSDFMKTWANGAGLVIILLFVFYNMAVYAMLAMTPLVLQDTHGFSPQAAGIAFSVILLPGALLQPYSGHLSDRFGRMPVIRIGLTVAIFAGAVAWLSPGVWVIIAAAAVALSVLVAIRPAMLAVAVDHASDRAGTSLGFAFTIMDGFGACGAVLAGMAGEFDLSLAYLLGAGFSASTLAVAFVIVRRGRVQAA
ncbi:MAG: MFS transporter [Alphaproteobacteria bacterium]